MSGRGENTGHLVDGEKRNKSKERGKKERDCVNKGTNELIHERIDVVNWWILV